MDYPKNKEEWWELFDANKEALLNLVVAYHPVRLNTRRPTVPDMPITAVRSENYVAKIRDKIAKETTEAPGVLFDQIFTRRDGQAMVQLLNNTWFGIPESEEARGLPGFFPLCDLCSEGHVFYAEEEKPGDAAT